MMSKKLSFTDQIKKLDLLTKKAKLREKSTNIVDKIGVVTIYSSAIDFALIQAGRLLEQIILKKQLSTGTPTFKPHEDDWFFDQQIRSRKIITEIKKCLPFTTTKSEEEDIVKNINELGKEFLKESDKFLTLRNKLMHHLFSPKYDLNKILLTTEKTILQYHKVIDTYKNFTQVVYPYRFSDKEIKYFYGSS